MDWWEFGFCLCSCCFADDEAGSFARGEFGLLYPSRAGSYLLFLKEDVEFVQLQSLLQLNSLVSIGKTRDKVKVALVQIVQEN